MNIIEGRVVAIKSFSKKNLNKNGDNMEKIMRDKYNEKLNNPSIAKIFEDDEHVLIGMEWH